MKQALAVVLIFSLILTVTPTGIQAQTASLPMAAAVTTQYDQYDVYFTPEQLENLLAPIALYPDPLLAQVLLAATFPDQIDEAARSVRAYGSGYNIDDAYWDVSVKAVAHYPTVLSMMADKIDWTVSLGQAYVNQSTEVMEAVQRLRRQARSAGYLVTTPQQEIVEADGYVYIYPAQPQYIYVPSYDPAIVFVARPGFHAAVAIWFSIGFIIGAWLNNDCDWGHHRIFYHGWAGGGPAWINRSRPHVRINNVYVNNNYRDVNVNRRVVDRSVNYGALSRYNTVHRDVDYGNVRRARAGAPPVPTPSREPQRDNKIIRRNMDPNDPRIGANRGREQQPSQQQRGNVQVPRVPATTQPQAPPAPQQRGNVQVPRVPPTTQPQAPPAPQQRGNVQVPRVPATTQPQAPPVPQQRGNVQVPRVPATTQPQAPRTAQPAQQPRAQAPRAPESVFRGGGGTFDPRTSGQRGQASRQSQPAPAARQAQAPKAPKAPQSQPRQQQQQRRR